MIIIFTFLVSKIFWTLGWNDHIIDDHHLLSRSYEPDARWLRSDAPPSCWSVGQKKSAAMEMNQTRGGVVNNNRPTGTIHNSLFFGWYFIIQYTKTIPPKMLTKMDDNINAMSVCVFNFFGTSSTPFLPLPIKNIQKKPTFFFKPDMENTRSQNIIPTNIQNQCIYIFLIHSYNSCA